MMQFLFFFLFVIAFFVVCYVVFWLVDHITFPPTPPNPPFGTLIKSGLAILALILFLGMVFGQIPVPPLLNFK